MSTLSTDLGAVTAYAYAVRGGFRGTAQEFATSLADLGNASSSATNALISKADLVDGKIPSSQLPSYVDDVIEGYLNNGDFYNDNQYTDLITPERGKIYIDITDSEGPQSYYWTGSLYIKTSDKSIKSRNDVIYEEPIPGSVTLSKQNIVLDKTHTSDTITLSNATGEVSVSSSNTNIITATIENNTIVVSSVENSYGSANVIVNIASTNNTNPGTEIITVEVARYFTISFNANGATGTMDPIQVKEGLTSSALSSCSYIYHGYSFTGWNTASDGSGITYDGSTVINNNVTLYAMWSLNSYSYFLATKTINDTYNPDTEESTGLFPNVFDNDFYKTQLRNRLMNISFRITNISSFTADFIIRTYYYSGGRVDSICEDISISLGANQSYTYEFSDIMNPDDPWFSDYSGDSIDIGVEVVSNYMELHKTVNYRLDEISVSIQ